MSTVDKNQKAVIETKTLVDIQKGFKSNKTTMHDIDTSVQKILSEVSEFVLDVSINTSKIDKSYDNCVKTLDTIIDDVETLSNDKLGLSLRDTTDNLQRFLKKLGQIDVANFKPGDILKLLDAEKLTDVISKSYDKTTGKNEIYRLIHALTSILDASNVDKMEKLLFKMFKPLITDFLGFIYVKDGDYYTTTKNSMQSKFGFMDMYEHFGQLLGMDIHTKIMVFKSGGKEYRFQLWKGKYGDSLGGEIGMYYRDDDLGTFLTPYDDKNLIKDWLNYRTLSEKDQMSMVQIVYDSKTNKPIFTNDSKKTAKNGKHWWNLMIKVEKKNKKYNKDNVHVENEITFKDNKLRKDYLKRLKKEKDIDILNDGSKNGGKIRYRW